MGDMSPKENKRETADLSKAKANKDYDFEIQLAEANKAEDKFRQLLLAKGATFEVKTERRMWHDTGNLVIEYESYNKPSGIAATKADYWVHELRTQEDETLVYLMFPTPVLRKICNDLVREDGHCRRGGENKQMEMLLIDLEKILTRLRHFSGSGDPEFLTRPERADIASRNRLGQKNK